VETDLGNILARITLIIVLVLLNGYFTASEMALVSIRRTRIKQLIDEGNNQAILVQKLLDKPSSFMATIQISVTMLGLMSSAFAAIGLAYYPTHWLIATGLSPGVAHSTAVFLITVCVGVLIIVVGVISPKSMGIHHAEYISLRTARVIYGLSVIALPLVKVVTFLSDLLARLFGARVKFSTPILTEEELKMLVEAGEEEGVIEVEEKEMIHSIFDFTDTVTKQVMVPRTDMDCAPVSSSLHELLEVITRSGHSRIPIYEDNVDNVLGVVHAKDLLTFLVKGRVDDFDAHNVMREAYFIPGSKDVDELLAEFQRDNIQLAIVRDEYGGTAGLVTVEDLLEEIVGEIRDEYDVSEEPMLQTLQDDEYLVNARMRVDELNEQIGTNFPEDEDYETIGGFVFDLFGHQPSTGDMISFRNLDLEVAEMESGRIQKIRVRKSDTDIDEETEIPKSDGKTRS